MSPRPRPSPFRRLHHHSAAVHKFPQRPALAHRPFEGGEFQPYTSITYEEAGERAAAIGSAFTALGAKAHDRVGIMSINCPEWMLSMQVGEVECGLRCGGRGGGCERLSSGSGVQWAMLVLYAPCLCCQHPPPFRPCPLCAFSLLHQTIEQQQVYRLVHPHTPPPLAPITQGCNRMSLACTPLYDTLGDEAVLYVLNHSGERPLYVWGRVRGECPLGGEPGCWLLAQEAPIRVNGHCLRKQELRS